MFRERWLLAIAELGATRAAEDAAEAFVLRSGCTLEEGRTIVARAWRLLGIADDRPAPETQPAT
jgi:hypothetical protein